MKVSYKDIETGITVTAKLKGHNWHVECPALVGKGFKEGGTYVPDGFYFDKWVKGWEQAGLVRV